MVSRIMCADSELAPVATAVAVRAGQEDALKASRAARFVYEYIHMSACQPWQRVGRATLTRPRQLGTPDPSTLNPQRRALNPQPSTLNDEPSTRQPAPFKPPTVHPQPVRSASRATSALLRAFVAPTAGYSCVW
jgi:hypothetical protein